MDKIIEMGVIPVYSEKRNQMIFGYKANVDKQTVIARCVNFDMLLKGGSNLKEIIIDEELELKDYKGIPCMQFKIDNVGDDYELLSIALFTHAEHNGGNE